MSYYEGPGFNIASFKANMDENNEGILRDNQYLVRIPFPSGLRDNRAGQADMLTTDRNIELRCDGTKFPSTGQMNYGSQRYGYGASESRPILPKFTPLECSFICDRHANMHKFFCEWVKITVNYDFFNGISSPSTTVGGTTMVPYEVGYKPEYAVELELIMYNPTGEPVRDVSFRDAYPIAVSDIPLRWGSRSQYLKIPVSFAFTDWYDNDLH